MTTADHESTPRMRFVLGGVPVRVQASALVTLGALFVLVYADLAESRIGAGAAAVVAAVTAASFLFSVVVHELAHAGMARSFELEVEEVRVFYLGGVTRLRDEASDPEQELAIALSGPLVNLLLAGLLLVAAELLGGRTVPGVVLGFLGDLNAVIGGFNLLPAHPLDGGAILRAGLTRATGNRATAVRWSSRAGQALGGLLVVVGIIGGLTRSEGSFGLLWLAVIGMFVLGAARAGLLQADVRQRLENVTVADLAEPLRWIGQVDWTVAMVVARVARTQGIGLVVDGANRPVGTFGPDDLATVPTNHWEHLTLGESMASVTGSFDAATPVTRVLSRFAEDRGATFAVIDRGQPIGLLDAQKIVNRLQS